MLDNLYCVEVFVLCSCVAKSCSCVAKFVHLLQSIKRKQGVMNVAIFGMSSKIYIYILETCMSEIQKSLLY